MSELFNEEQTTVTDEVEKEISGETNKTFTQEELNKIISERLNKERLKHEKDIEAKVSEAAKVAKMSAEEKFQHELEQRETAIRQRELELEARDLRIKATDTLAKEGLPIDFANILSYSDEQTLNEGVVALKDIFEKAINQEIENRANNMSPVLRGTKPVNKTTTSYSPAGGNVSGNDPFVKGLGK